MQRECWDIIEQTLDSLAIRPIVGVIPDNKDPQLMCSPVDSGFWTRVRSWEKKGWRIAMHGLHHIYHPILPGVKPLIPVSAQSEFAGLPLNQQLLIIRQAWQQFLAEGIKPSLFMAPAHTFDNNTLLALKAETDIRIITDGHAFFPFRDQGFVWIPQQFWRFRPMPFGIWSICLHPNTMCKLELETFLSDCTRYCDQIIDSATIGQKSVRVRNHFDRMTGKVFSGALSIKKLL